MHKMAAGETHKQHGDTEKLRDTQHHAPPSKEEEDDVQYERMAQVVA